MFTHEAFHNHQKVLMFNSLGGYLQGFIAIHNTKNGPALGGTRYWEYDTPNDALRDVLRLSSGMSYKNALANLPLGGGKAVIMKDRAFDGDRKELFEAFGEIVESFGGEYYTAIDVGTTIDDMKIVNTKTDYVAGVKNAIDGSTAQGCYNAIRGAMSHFGSVPAKHTFMIQGLGKTGYGLAKLLHKDGANLKVYDIDPNKCIQAHQEFGAEIIDEKEVYSTECDVFSPCALGGIINDTTLSQFKCKIICGTANNQLVSSRHGDSLLKRKISYVPDFLANAGGVIAAAKDVDGLDHMEQLDKIVDRAFEVVVKSERQNINTEKLAKIMSGI